MRRTQGTTKKRVLPRNSIKDTCNRALWIEKGELRADGPALEVIREYQAFTKAEKAREAEQEPG